MTFPSWRVLGALTVGWLVILFGATWLLDPQPGVIDRTNPNLAFPEDGQAHLRIWLRYPCGRNAQCLPTVHDKLDAIDWLGKPKLVAYKQVSEELTEGGIDDAYEVETVLSVERIEAVVDVPQSANLLEVVEAIGELGLVPDRVEYSAPGHYTIDADLTALQGAPSSVDSRIAIDAVLGDATAAFDHLVTEYRARGYYDWYDSVGVAEAGPPTEAVDPVARALRFYPALGKPVDIMEIVTGLGQIGLKPSALTIRPEAGR